MTQLGVYLLAHILGDFYLQSNSLAEEKENSLSHLIAHSAIYAGALAAASAALFNSTPCTILLLALAIFTSHAVIDGPVRHALKRKEGTNQAFCLVVDQLFHAAFLMALVVFGCSCLEERAGIKELLASYSAGLVWLSAFLSCGRPAAILVANVLGAARLTEHPSSCSSAEETDASHSGRWIGIIERVIVVSLTILGDYSAIAFVFTAKSIARFKEIEMNQSFAEVYLLGTLVSVAFAMLSGLFFRYCFLGA